MLSKLYQVSLLSRLLLHYSVLFQQPLLAQPESETAAERVVIFMKDSLVK
jgi:hypothetical protein